MSRQARKPLTARGERTRCKLLHAAEREFGEFGFHNASVSSITRRAGVAQGTFYIYYSSKEAILRELVDSIGQKLRRTLKEATDGLATRMEMERQGLLTFLEFAIREKNLYRVVLESQFIDESIYRDYYERLAEAYTAQLQRSQELGETRAGSATAQAWALMGIANFLGLRYSVWEGRLPPAEVVDTVMAFIEGGLTPEDAAAAAAKRC
ncbi:TetR/AcrR family transcriptional regulator [Methylonatrum kenyense]|uniref:TetR/AcrR family transcriptional regulator n=1 Tax=Methylonatrum kenyense TaxID=455253 RepID=UPI0020BFAE08|nr:TetR/AcrR family transcriptional regulator [Methylonatrum kenyense]MCK8516439.1 TetR/AcrR family transcriptional regulator [Methylonatrum kenyense]